MPLDDTAADTAPQFFLGLFAGGTSDIATPFCDLLILSEPIGFFIGGNFGGDALPQHRED